MLGLAGYSSLLRVSLALVFTFICWDFRLSCNALTHKLKPLNRYMYAQIHIRLAYPFLENPAEQVGVWLFPFPVLSIPDIIQDFLV
jgi:hypothetical protein